MPNQARLPHLEAGYSCEEPGHSPACSHAPESTSPAIDEIRVTRGVGVMCHQCQTMSSAHCTQCQKPCCTAHTSDWKLGGYFDGDNLTVCSRCGNLKTWHLHFNLTIMAACVVTAAVVYLMRLL